MFTYDVSRDGYLCHHNLIQVAKMLVTDPDPIQVIAANDLEKSSQI